jgi:hypothetical protein
LLQAVSGTGEQVDHLGSMLLSFLQRFGVDFDRDREAVAVKRGGFVKKSSMGRDFARKGILSLEDPLTGEAWLCCWIVLCVGDRACQKPIISRHMCVCLRSAVAGAGSPACMFNT